MQIPELVNSVLSRPHYESPADSRTRRLNGVDNNRRRFKEPLDIEIHDSAYFAGIISERSHDHHNGRVNNPDDCLKVI